MGKRLEARKNSIDQSHSLLLLYLSTWHIYIRRITMFDFEVEDTQEKPTVTFMGEEPYLQYVSDRVHNMELIHLYTISSFCFTSELSCDWEMYWTAELHW